MINSPKSAFPAGGDYFAAADSWVNDQNQLLRASRRLAWWVAAAACLVAVLEAIALVALTPLKTVAPYIVTVDRQTGYAEIAKPTTGESLTQNQIVTQSNLARYVLARETFDATDLRANYQQAMLFSAADARTDYTRLMRKDALDGPLTLYAPTTTVTVTITSISQLSPTTALIRFETVQREAGAEPELARHWVAALAFRYTRPPMRPADRMINPLGFEVTRYRRDEELTASAARAGR